MLLCWTANVDLSKLKACFFFFEDSIRFWRRQLW